MAGFREHNFERFNSKEELQETLTRKKASMAFRMANEDVTMDGLLRMSMQSLLIDAVSIGLHPTCLVKDRLEMLLNDEVDDFISFAKGENIDDLAAEEVLKGCKEMMEVLKGMTEQEIYDVISK